MTLSARTVCVTACVLWTTVFACGSPSTGQSGTCTVSGTIQGSSFDARDCTSGATVAGGQYTTDIVLTDFLGACGVVGASALKASSKIIDLHFTGNTPLAVGTYKANGAGLDAQFATYNATCNSPSGGSATGGQILVTAIAPSIKGTFDLYFSGDHLTGWFDVSSCAIVATDAATPCM